MSENIIIKCVKLNIFHYFPVHYQKVIHRDIKPSNLLRADNGEVKIADLGVSDEFDGVDAMLTATAGTPAFTPPECLTTTRTGVDGWSGKAADIWSLGVTLFSLVTGFLPFPGVTVMEVYDKIKSQDPEVIFSRDSKSTNVCVSVHFTVRQSLKLFT